MNRLGKENAAVEGFSIVCGSTTTVEIKLYAIRGVMRMGHLVWIKNFPFSVEDVTVAVKTC